MIEPGEDWRARLMTAGRYLAFGALALLIAATCAWIATAIDPHIFVRGVGTLPIEADTSGRH